MTLDQLKQLLELGYPAIITVAFVVLAKWYRDDTMNQIEYLRKEIDECKQQIGLSNDKRTP